MSPEHGGLASGLSQAAGVRCEDSFDRETRGHVDGLELHHDELPGLVPHLLAGEEIEVADAARDRRTVELHRILMSTYGTKGLLVVPARRDDQVIGGVWLEDSPSAEENRDFVRAVANMVAFRLADASMAPTPRKQSAVGKPLAMPENVPRSLTANLRPTEIDSSALQAQIHRGLAVMVLRFTDAAAMALRPSGGSRCISDEIACALQQIAADNGIPYLKLAGHEVVAAAGFPPAEAAAATVIADMAVAVRERCVTLFENSDQAHEFQLGIDYGTAIGSVVGAAPRVYNLWGDAVRVAGLMAASAPPGTVQATEAAYQRLRQEFLFRPRGSFYLPHFDNSRTFVLAGRL